jgi:glycerol-3-phosphate acyltransferase PlsY
MELPMQPLAFALAAYLLGSLSFAVIVSRLFGLSDPRSYGSGNPGATNVLRSGKKLAALLTLFGDMLKGVVAVLAARALGADTQTVALVAVAVTVGHLWPVFFGFSGGKGVATAAGVLFALDWRLGGLTLIAWLLAFALTRISSVGALVAALAAPVIAWWLMPNQAALFGAVLVLAALLVQRHKANIVGLLRGTERRFGGGSDPTA